MLLLCGKTRERDHVKERGILLESASSALFAETDIRGLYNGGDSVLVAARGELDLFEVLLLKNLEVWSTGHIEWVIDRIATPL